MTRTSRLFQLTDALRGNRHPVTASALAERLGVSERTIYRDIQAWTSSARRWKGRPASATCCAPASSCRR